MTLAALHSLDFHFDWSLMGPPLLAGLLVASTHVLLGRRVLERGIIFIDLTIAQVAALGVILAGVGEDSGGIGTPIAAAVEIGRATWGKEGVSTGRYRGSP